MTTQFLNYVRGLGSFDVANFWRRQAVRSQGLLQRRCLACGREVGPEEEYRRSGWNVAHLGCPG